MLFSFWKNLQKRTKQRTSMKMKNDIVKYDVKHVLTSYYVLINMHEVCMRAYVVCTQHADKTQCIRSNTLSVHLIQNCNENWKRKTNFFKKNTKQIGIRIIVIKLQNEVFLSLMLCNFISRNLNCLVSVSLTLILHLSIEFKYYKNSYRYRLIFIWLYH